MVLGILWDLHQQHRINALESQAHHTSSPSQEIPSALHMLEDRIDKLTLISMSLWELLKEHSDLTEEDLLSKIKEIDLSDGKLDGKVRQNVANCPQCNRVMSQKHKRCLYCGHEVSKPNTAFGDVTS